MLTKFKQHCFSKFSFLKQKRLLLACSGGVDSVVLLNLLHQLDFSFSIAHCNFQLRNNASDKDELFVQQLSEKTNKSFFSKRFNTQAYAKEKKISIQMAARDLRYKWFNELADIHQFDYLLTAHHLNDQIESFFINLSRGTGIAGLSGIPEKRLAILRPLLIFSKEELLNYAQKEKLDWREDESNSKDDYLRNSIRHNLVPVLENTIPDFPVHFQKTQKHLSLANEAINEIINQWKEKHFELNEDEISIELTELKSLKPLNFYLFSLFSSYGFTNIKNLHELVFAQSGKQLFSETHVLLKNRNHFLLKEKTTTDSSIHFWDLSLPLHFPISLEKIEYSTKTSISLDFEKLELPLTIRKVQEGDCFYPSGMLGKKKVTKYFKDEKFSLFEKEKQWLLCSKENIVWIIGKRADRRFLATQKTEKIIHINRRS